MALPIHHTIAGVEKAAASIPEMRSLLLAQGGDVVLERYFNGGAAYMLNDVRSVTKSILSSLVGIAIGHGSIASVDDPISEYLSPVVELDAPVARVTIRDLLTMRAGHEWDVFGGADFQDWVSSSDLLMHVLEKPVVHEPGKRWVYSDGSAHVLSAVLSEATGRSALQFASEFLFQPLGIDERQAWEGTYRGYNRGGVGLALRSREMLAFAELYLHGGRYQSRQVVPEEWVTTSLHPHVENVAAGADEAAGPFSYGYYWWLGSAASGRRLAFAKGYGGQMIALLPGESLVAIATTNHWKLDAAQNLLNEAAVFDLVNRFLESLARS